MAFFEIQWRASTKKDLRAIPPHEVERIVAAVEKLSDEPFPYGFQKLTSTLVTPTGKVVNCRNGFGQVSIAQNGRDRAESPYWLSLTT